MDGLYIMVGVIIFLVPAMPWVYVYCIQRWDDEFRR
jgi:hypothetical protein